MLKELALDNFWMPRVSKTKSASVLSKSGDKDWHLWLAIGLTVVSAVLLMSYIYGVNEYSAEGYEIKVLQTRLTDLTDANKQINLKIAEATSMVAIQNDYLQANFVPAGSSKFLQNSQFTER